MKDICVKCGLPNQICVCEAIIRMQKMKNKIIPVVDDFEYCFLCNCFHYPAQHKRLTN